MSKWGDRVVFVTGGGAGIGRAFCQLAANLGARVVAVDANAAAAAETVASIGQDRTMAVVADVTSEAQLANAVDAAVARFGTIDVLHNNASILLRNDAIEKMAVDEFRKVIEVNAIGMFLAARAIVPVMKRTGRGVIVNMSSRGGARGQAHTLAYSLAKAGILSFTRGLGEQLAPFGIRVNALNSGLVETAMTSGGFYLERAKRNKAYVFRPEEMAAAVAYLVDRDDMNGQVLEYFGAPAGPELHLIGDFAARKIAGYLTPRT